MIDAIEREIEVYGETPALKDSVITLSLLYNIRCRYTAYIADYTTIYNNVEDIWEEPQIIPRSYIIGNYPNPFNPSTTIRFYLDPLSTNKVKLIKIYNILGQLIFVIDITHLKTGWHEIIYNGQDFFGNLLSSGIYFITLQVNGKTVSTIKVNFVK